MQVIQRIQHKSAGEEVTTVDSDGVVEIVECSIRRIEQTSVYELGSCNKRLCLEGGWI